MKRITEIKTINKSVLFILLIPFLMFFVAVFLVMRLTDVGEKLLYAALGSGDVRVVKALFALQIVEPNIDEGFYYSLHGSPLGFAIANHDRAMVRNLLKVGANPNSVECCGVGTPLHIAASSGDIEIVKELLKAGADPNITNLHKESPLDLAQKHSHKEVIAILQKN